MSRKRITSRMLGKAELRAAGLKAINPQLDFGNSRSVEQLTDLIAKLRARIDAYNTALAVIDSSKSEIESLEKMLGELTEQLLIGVAYQYGNDSREYEMAGGVRKSDRVRRSSISRIRANAESQSSQQLPTS
ncbi:hypothetical protein H6G89_04725 [Oscillatoria sp. FACHB-1407]|uniref:hypothetical protein n=2 Tax=Oscillatoria sp. FACHB-1407 TaxID=2692847 RepID=UPI0016870219|nr:hypothetical protein [Oscillatoria sp. FACHB-1407]